MLKAMGVIPGEPSSAKLKAMLNAMLNAMQNAMLNAMLKTARGVTQKDKKAMLKAMRAAMGGCNPWGPLVSGTSNTF